MYILLKILVLYVHKFDIQIAADYFSRMNNNKKKTIIRQMDSY